MANLNDMNWQYVTKEKDGKSIVLDDASCILIRKMELTCNDPEVEEENKEREITLFDTHKVVISEDGKNLFLDRHGKRVELNKAPKNSRYERNRPSYCQKHLGQSQLTLKVEVTDRYFIQKVNGAEFPIADTFDCLRISEYEEARSKDKNLDKHLALPNIGITIDFDKYEIIN